MLKKNKNTKDETKKAGAKKVTRRKRKSANTPIDGGIYTEIDQVYKALNRVQINRDTVNFVIRETDAPIVDNILRDLDLPTKKKKSKNDGRLCIEYTVSPGKEVPRTDHLDDIEELPDEILEDGQVFF